MKTPSEYEKQLLEIMINDNSTLSEAIYIDLMSNNIDTDSVFDVVDHLEEKLQDLNKVEYYMAVYTGNLPDVGLRKML